LTEGCEFSINLIPHTIDNTALGTLQQGSSVNLEIDLIARYVERMLNNEASANSTSSAHQAGKHS
jgi:riboflavin synthase